MDSTLAAEADAELSRCMIGLLLREPFFGHLLGSVAREISDIRPTLSVGAPDGHVVLQVNPHFFLHELVNRSQRIAVLKHEALHLVFKHIFRGGDRERHRWAWDMACEVVVNQYIGDWELPDDAVTLACFEELDLPPERTADQYYERLLTAGKQAPSVSAAMGREHFCDADSWGHTPPARPSSAPQPPGLQGVSRQASQAGVDRMIRIARSRTSDHDWGALPEHLRELLNARLQPENSTVNWRRALRLFASSSRRTRISSTLRRESRRFMTIPGIKVKRFQKVAVALDTSGSVDARQIAAVFGEVHAMWRAGAEIDVIECDAVIQRTWRYTGKPPTDIEGRGGTAFDPVFEHLHAHRHERYDACIYITDGEGPRPTRRPPCKLLWLLTPDGTDKHLDFGRVVRLGRG